MKAPESRGNLIVKGIESVSACNDKNGKIYIHNNVWKFCGDNILIKFFFGCRLEIQKKF